MNNQTKLKTETIVQSNNISFLIGTIAVVEEYFNKLAFSHVFGKYKKKERDINVFIQALVSYKMTENLSISKASEWINRSEVLLCYQLKPFEEQTLFQILEILGKNYEGIIFDIQDILFKKIIDGFCSKLRARVGCFVRKTRNFAKIIFTRNDIFNQRLSIRV